MLHTEDWRPADLGKMTSRAKFHYFVLLAAIEVFLTVSWLGFITVQPVSITTLHIPVLLAACPSAMVVTALCLQYERSDAFASKCIFLSTVLSAVTIPLLIWLLF